MGNTVVFLDTDIFVIKQLSGVYQIKWYIIFSAASLTDYEEEIKEISNKEVHIERFQIYNWAMNPRNLMRFISLAKAMRDSRGKCVCKPVISILLFAGDDLHTL